MEIDIEQIKILLDMVSKADIAELTIAIEEERITIKKSGVVALPPAAIVNHEFVASPTDVAGSNKASSSSTGASTNNPAPQQDKAVSEKEASYVPITSPMVGTFYRSSSPTTAPFVETGDKIAVGQTICIIEAMKLMNDLPAEISGKVVKVCAENGATVEFGQQLFLVDPKA